MKTKLQNVFGVTENGANNVIKACFTAILVFIAEMAPIGLLVYYVQNVIEGHPLSLSTMIIGLIAIIVVAYSFMYIDYNATYTATYQESFDIRVNIAEILQKLPLSYFSQRDLTDLSQTLMSDVERLEHALSHAISKTVGFVICFTLVTIAMLFFNVPLSLCILIPVLVSAACLIFSKKAQEKAVTKYWKQLRANSDSFQEAIELQQEIKAYNLAEQFHDSLYQQMEDSERIHIKSEFTQGMPLSIANPLVRLTIGIVIFFGSTLYFQGKVSLIVFIVYLLLAIKISDALQNVYFDVAEIFYINSAVKNINTLRNIEQQIGEDVALETFDIELKDVKFGYKDAQQVIKGVSFTANQNEITALVGPSGCGKTTLLRLVSRLYDYEEGQILVGGHDIKQISTNSLFDKISIVFQDVTLFNNTVLENIRMGRPDATDEEVKEAARLANCQDFIAKLPQGFDTKIGENGAKLSGGERQRLSIARAILKQAPIVLLDEITSSLDIENEKLIQESLNYLLKDKTVLIISHRLKSVENADKIVVLKDGQIDGIGRHTDLLESSAVYRELIETSQKIENFKYKKNA
ncbi:MAG: ABC transporter ATP-binding protein [Streptococcus sp.]|nr:ABC transporter ATP-binding protein [Streptococcus sp.]